MPQDTIDIVIPLFEGVAHLDFTGPHQVLGYAPSARVTVASLDGRDIESSGLVFSQLADLGDVKQCDVLCIPGGWGVNAAMLDERFMGEIRRLAALAAWHTSVCSGSLVLAAAGLLTGKRATAHWLVRDHLAAFGVIVETARVVRDGKVITGGGVTAGIDFGFVLLAELFGRDLAEAAQLGLEYAPAPPFDAGRPETAGPERAAQLQAQWRREVEETRRAVHEAVSRLRRD